MSKINFIEQIDWALENIEMSAEMREFLINLKTNVPVLEGDRFKAYTEWMQIVMMAIKITEELSKYT